MAEDLVHVAHQGAPCDPPVIDGVVFAPLGDPAGLWVGACTEEQAMHITRGSRFSRYGGQPPDITLLKVVAGIADAVGIPLPPDVRSDVLADVYPPPTDTVPADAGEIPPPPADEPTDPIGDDGSEGEGEEADPTDDGAPGEEATDTTGNKYPAKKKKNRR